MKPAVALKIGWPRHSRQMPHPDRNVYRSSIASGRAGLPCMVRGAHTAVAAQGAFFGARTGVKTAFTRGGGNVRRQAGQKRCGDRSLFFHREPFLCTQRPFRHHACFPRRNGGRISCGKPFRIVVFTALPDNRPSGRRARFGRDAASILRQAKTCRNCETMPPDRPRRRTGKRSAR
jgi:hypothetical protein